MDKDPKKAETKFDEINDLLGIINLESSDINESSILSEKYYLPLRDVKRFYINFWGEPERAYINEFYGIECRPVFHPDSLRDLDKYLKNTSISSTELDSQLNELKSRIIMNFAISDSFINNILNGTDDIESSTFINYLFTLSNLLLNQTIGYNRIEGTEVMPLKIEYQFCIKTYSVYPKRFSFSANELVNEYQKIVNKFHSFLTILANSFSLQYKTHLDVLDEKYNIEIICARLQGLKKFPILELKTMLNEPLDLKPEHSFWDIEPKEFHGKFSFRTKKIK